MLTSTQISKGAERSSLGYFTLGESSAFKSPKAYGPQPIHVPSSAYSNRYVHDGERAGSPCGGGLRWSPDGAQILFSNYEPGGHVRAYVTPSQGGTPRPLLPDDNEGQSDPSWSPDGHKVVFSTLEAIGAFNSVYGSSTLPATRSRLSPDWKACGRLDGHPTVASSPGSTLVPQEPRKSSTLRRSDGRYCKKRVRPIFPRGRRIANSFTSCSPGMMIRV
jgi:dipeptidyl aminopeptidase/acylaminoacyl peptidase